MSQTFTPIYTFSISPFHAHHTPLAQLSVCCTVDKTKINLLAAEFFLHVSAFECVTDIQLFDFVLVSNSQLFNLSVSTLNCHLNLRNITKH